jgi:hypothetical protein
MSSRMLRECSAGPLYQGAKTGIKVLTSLAFSLPGVTNMSVKSLGNSIGARFGCKQHFWSPIRG